MSGGLLGRVRRRVAEPDQPQEWEEPAFPSTASTGARANAAAVARLLVWLLVTAGPVIGLLAWQRASAPVPVVRGPEVPVDVVTGDPVGPAGFASLYVRTYLESAPEQYGEALAVFYPGAGEVRAGGGGAEQVGLVAAVSSQEVARDYWAVTVAAEVAVPSGEDDGPSRLRYFQVPVAAAGDGWVAVAYPSEVAAPDAAGEAAGLGYTRAELAGGDPALVTLREFLGAYLAGTGEVSRYLAPEADLAAVTPPPYSQVEVVSVAVRGGEVPAPGEQLPMTAGARWEVLVEAEAYTPGGVVRPVSYALVLAERDGRWEIAAVQAAPGVSDETTAAEEGAQ